MLLRVFNDTTPLVNNHNVGQKNKKAEANGGVKVEANASIEGAAPVNESSATLEVKPGPYGAIVADKDGPAALMDVNAEKIEKGEDTGGLEQQLNGTGGVEGQLGGVS
jgi:multisite-specific tRNA:(cytosine-C5)-methyltransferase